MNIEQNDEVADSLERLLSDGPATDIFRAEQPLQHLSLQMKRSDPIPGRNLGVRHIATQFGTIIDSQAANPARGVKTMKATDFSITLAALLLCSSLHAGECEVTLPDRNNLPDSLLSVPEGFAWVGSPELAAKIPINGHWKGMGPERNYFDKWWWWRDGYRATEEADPELVVTATRLDESSPPVVVRNATNAFGPADESGPGWDAMLVGMEFPTSGCWEVVGKYRDQELRFVFEVGGTSELADEPRVWEDESGKVKFVDLSLTDRRH